MSIDPRAWLLRAARPLGRHFPALIRLGRAVGLRRWAVKATPAQIVIDGDIIIELDVSVRGHRYWYYLYDLNKAHELALIRRLVDAETVFIDAGANIGVWTLAAAKRAARVIAFEPGASSLARLRRNLALNPDLAVKITVNPLALGAVNSTGYLRVDDSQPEQATLVDEHTGEAGERVPIVTLDEMLTSIGFPADALLFLKLDVEGAEMATLKGSQHLVAELRPIILSEIFEPHLNRHGASSSDLIQFLAARNYVGYLAQDSETVSGFRVEDLDLAALSRTRVNTGLFIPIERLEAARRQMGIG